MVDERTTYRPAGGAPDESGLRIEYIRRGEYHVDLFGRRDDRRNRRNYNFTEVADPRRREFDWDDGGHLSDLNKWAGGTPPNHHGPEYHRRGNPLQQGRARVAR